MVKDYSLGKIYKIESSQCDKYYIGSTCAPMLSHRMRQHRHDYSSYLNGKSVSYTSSFELLKYDDAKIILIEKYPCNDVDELRAREGYWQKELWDECVNRKQEGRTIKQYYQDNADKYKEYWKQYKKDNADKLKEYQKQYASQKAKCDICNKEMTRGSLTRHKKNIHK